MWQHKICGVPAMGNYPLSVVPKSEDESDENFSRFSSIFRVIDTHLDSQTTPDRYIQFSIRENKYDFPGF